ncbi:MAG TPA: carboxypeptidase-like regulatory domain-containing protein [Longimicrobiales bacterium]
MSTPGRWSRAACLAVGIVALGAGALHAQDAAGGARLAGRVIDAEGRPVPGLAVSAHGVSQAGGAEVARTTTDEDGRFELAFETRDGATYFAAARYEGGLYVGPLFRDPRDAPADYVIVVGRDPIAVGAGPAAGRSAPPPAPPRGPLLALIGVLGVGAVLWPLTSPQRRPYAVRALLHALAELEERHAAAAVAGAEYEKEKTALRGRLRELTRTAS